MNYCVHDLKRSTAAFRIVLPVDPLCACLSEPTQELCQTSATCPWMWELLKQHWLFHRNHHPIDALPSQVTHVGDQVNADEKLPTFHGHVWNTHIQYWPNLTREKMKTKVKNHNTLNKWINKTHHLLAKFVTQCLFHKKRPLVKHATFLILVNCICAMCHHKEFNQQPVNDDFRNQMYPKTVQGWLFGALVSTKSKK